ncbi:MAG TPA: ABC transporter ATP-binding protein, partial [Steroidobacteraceae bacterium]|nr:ABC transporter ATP-binding protein [Steroidobacteraceae bacterium]
MNAAHTMMSERAGIRVREVSYRYRRGIRDALDNVSLEIERGSIFGLLGPNGAGKSTLLGLLSGSLQLQRGEIAIGEMTLPRDRRRIQTQSAVVPQDYAFYQDLTGRENLEFFAGMGALSKDRTRSRIAAVGEICRLTDVLSQRAADYSGGLKRRLNMAIGLLHEPKILYLDEPTVGIDAESRRYIVEAIHDLRKNGVTIVYTSHYMEEVEQLCDAVAVIDRGRLVLIGKVPELLQRDGARLLTLNLSAPSPLLAESFVRYGAQHCDFREWRLEVPASQLLDVLGEATRLGAPIERVRYGATRLEKIYLDVLADASTERREA